MQADNDKLQQTHSFPRRGKTATEENQSKVFSNEDLLGDSTYLRNFEGKSYLNGN